MTEKSSSADIPPGGSETTQPDPSPEGRNTPRPAGFLLVALISFKLVVLAGASYLLFYPLEAPGFHPVFSAVALVGLGAILWRTERILMVVKIAVGVGLILVLFKRQEFDLSQLKEIRTGWPYFLAAQLLFATGFFLTTLRWKLLLKSLGVAVTFRSTVWMAMSGMFFNQFAPGGNGGDLVKAYYIAREHPGARTRTVFSVQLDRN